MGGRTVIKAAAVLITLGYCSLLVYQGGTTYNSLESRRGSVQLPEINNVVKIVGKPIVFNKQNKTGDNDIFINNFKNKIDDNKLALSDIFISVKTSAAYQNTRLPIILKTWFQLAKEETWFFTDLVNEEQQRLAGGHIINTKCQKGHQILPLCCKTAQEYDTFIKSGKKWFCHFDDDNYVNVPQLVKILQKYDPRKDWYLGRNSVTYPIRMGKSISRKKKLYFSFMFATFGAGVCISRSLALKMIPIASNNRFVGLCHRIKMPDDVTMGYIIEVLVKQKLTFVGEFHSHLEGLKNMPEENFSKQISLSYSGDNVVTVNGFDNETDPTRIYSLHCHLFPYFEYCRNKDIPPSSPTPVPLLTSTAQERQDVTNKKEKEDRLIKDVYEDLDSTVDLSKNIGANNIDLKTSQNND